MTNHNRAVDVTQAGEREAPSSRNMPRSFAALFTGAVVVVFLSIGTDFVLHATKTYPPWGERMSDGLFFLATAYRIIYAIAGSYIAAKLAPSKPMKHALILGVVGFVLSIAGVLAALRGGQELGPLWYPLALVVTALPCAWVGGRLAQSSAVSS